MIDRLFDFVETYASPVIFAVVAIGGVVVAFPGIKEALQTSLGN
jgi:hypothetical protein